MAANVAALLDKAKVIHRLSSDYKLALVLGVDQKSLRNYRQGITLPDARVISQLSSLTGVDPALLAVEIEAERAKTDEARALWRQVAARLSATLHAAIFAVLAGVVLAGSFPSGAHAAQALAGQVNPLYIVECVHRWCRGVFARLSRLAPLVLATLRALNFGENHVQSAASTAAA